MDNRVSLFLLVVAIALTVTAEYITEDYQRLATIDSISLGILYGSGVVYRNEKDRDS